MANKHPNPRGGNDKRSVLIQCGGVCFCGEIRRALRESGIQVYGGCDDPPPHAATRMHLQLPLSERERNVLQALCDHGTALAAARALRISVKAVNNVLARVRRKFGVPTTLEVIVLAFRRRLVQ